LLAILINWMPPATSVDNVASNTESVEVVTLGVDGYFDEDYGSLQCGD